VVVVSGGGGGGERRRTNAMEDPDGKTHRYAALHSVHGFARNDQGVDLPTNVTDEAVRKASSSTLGCLKRSASMARCWPGDAMLKLDPWRFASLSRASKRSGSRMNGGRSRGDKHSCGSCP
jgi:hypothetical protein